MLARGRHSAVAMAPICASRSEIALIEIILQATTWFPTIEHTIAQRLFLAGAGCRKVHCT